MTASKVIVTALAMICLVVAFIYLVSPETIGGPSTQGSLLEHARARGHL